MGGYSGRRVERKIISCRRADRAAARLLQAIAEEEHGEGKEEAGAGGEEEGKEVHGRWL